MQSNPVREAIVLYSNAPKAQNLLINELEILERFQPTDPNLNIRQVSSFDYFVKKHYRPKENIETIY